ncbi:MAG: diaminopimelate epimerase [Acidimicrobiia bacterium]
MKLTKHHGLGNDFLVLLDLDGRQPIDEEIARSLCDRHRGVGADGLIRVTAGEGGRVRMELRNEDGSRAEMSGNGISCLAQAVVRAGLAADGVVEVDTDAGPRTVTVVETEGPHRHRMRVAMGRPRLDGDRPEWVDERVLRATAVDMGNPHVVLHVADPDDVPDLVEVGERINAATAGGTNVELVLPGDPGRLRMLVFERGVGPTLACGTGAVAVAAAAHAWELAPATTTVEQPGGPAVVELSPDGPAHLTVPVVAIAAVEWPL